MNAYCREWRHVQGVNAPDKIKIIYLKTGGSVICSKIMKPARPFVQEGSDRYRERVSKRLSSRTTSLVVIVVGSRPQPLLRDSWPDRQGVSR